jgi:hypothetical protein
MIDNVMGQFDTVNLSNLCQTLAGCAKLEQCHFATECRIMTRS